MYYSSIKVFLAIVKLNLAREAEAHHFMRLRRFQIKSVAAPAASLPLYTLNSTRATFFPFRYSLIRYFNVAIHYRYSATFQKFAIRYLLYAIRYSLLPLNSVIGFI
jgi:hypothetical protein